MAEMNPQEQKKQFDKYIAQVERYVEINHNVYGELRENLDPVGPGDFDELIGLLPTETERFDEIMGAHNTYKSNFGPAKERLSKGGELGRLFEEYKDAVSTGERQNIEESFLRVDEAFNALITGIVTIYQPDFVRGIYCELARSDKKYSKTAERIDRILQILEDHYKVNELVSQA